MDVEILNLYSNVAQPKTSLIGDHGQSFLISTKDEKILFDVGTNGKKPVSYTHLTLPTN